jgi:hypothetical protein
MKPFDAVIFAGFVDVIASLNDSLGVIFAFPLDPAHDAQKLYLPTDKT